MTAGVAPKLFLTIGDTDHWSSPLALRSDSIDYDQSMRAVRRNAVNDLNWRSIAGVGSRNPAKGTAHVVEFTSSDSVGGLAFDGLVRVGSEATMLTSYAGSVAGSAGFQDSGAIYLNAALVQSGLAVHAASRRFSVALYREPGGTLKARSFINGRRNVLGYTEAFDNAAWVKSANAAITADATSAPAGFDAAIYGRADKLYESTTVNAIHEAAQTVTVVAGLHAFSCYMLAGERTWGFLQIGAGGPSCFFNLGTGVLGTAAGGATGTITAIGGGVYLCSIAATLTAAAHACKIHPAAGDGVNTYAGTVGSGIYIWGAQLEAAAATTYQRQSGAAGGYCGVPVTLTDGEYRLAWSGYQVGQNGAVHADADEQLHLADVQAALAGVGIAQPWGAAARVTDAGGSSPDATTLDVTTRSGTALTLDTFKRVASTSTALWDSVRGNIAHRSGAVHAGARYRWAEAQWQGGGGGAFIFLGVHLTNAAASIYPGADANGWGFYAQDFDTYHAGVGTGYVGTVTTANRIAVCLDTYTGKIYFFHLILTAGVWAATPINSANPEAGTGFAYSNVVGIVAPTIALNTGGGATITGRIFTHDRELVGKPVYATGWDGSNAMPSALFRDALVPGCRVRRGVSFAPWAERGGHDIQPISLRNEGAFYDALRLYALRGQSISVDRIWPGEATPEAVARLRCSFAKIDQGGNRITIGARPNASLAETRFRTETVALGRPWLLPAKTHGQSTNLDFKFGENPYCLLDGYSVVYGGGLPVTSYRQIFRDDANSSMAAFRRTVNVTTEQSMGEPVFYDGYGSTPVLLTNGDFTGSAIGTNPASWTTVETNPNSIVDVVAGGCRLYRAAGGPVASIAQTITQAFFIRITIDSYVKGFLIVTSPIGGAQNVQITAPGVYIVGTQINTAATLTIEAGDDSDMVVRRVERVASADVYGLTESSNVARMLLRGTGVSHVFSDTGSIGAANVGYYTAAFKMRIAILRELARARMGDLYEDESGVMRWAYLRDPANPGNEALLGSLEPGADAFVSYEDDLAPKLADRAQYDENFIIHTGAQLAVGATPTVQTTFTRPYSIAREVLAFETVDDRAALDPFYGHAIDAEPHATYSSAEGEASAYITRVEALYGPGKRRGFWTWRVPTTDVRGWRFGGYFKITEPRFFPAGATFVFVDADVPIDGATATIVGYR